MNETQEMNVHQPHKYVKQLATARINTGPGFDTKTHQLQSILSGETLDVLHEVPVLHPWTDET